MPDLAVALWGHGPGYCEARGAFLPDPAAVVKFGIDSPMAGVRKARFRSDDSLSLTAVLDFAFGLGPSSGRWLTRRAPPIHLSPIRTPAALLRAGHSCCESTRSPVPGAAA
jgi:hypothetical protein